MAGCLLRAGFCYILRCPCHWHILQTIDLMENPCHFRMVYLSMVDPAVNESPLFDSKSPPIYEVLDLSLGWLFSSDEISLLRLGRRSPDQC